MNPVYFLINAALDGISRLPFGVLYKMSDVIAFTLNHIVGYRKKVALKNISESYPNLTPGQHREILDKFYRNFSDYIVETIKLLHITDEEILSRMTFEGVEMMDRFLGEGRSIVAYFSHCGNWEWAPSITLHSRFRPGEGVEFCQVYRPLRNKWFDGEMLKIRSRFGSLSFKKSQLLRDLIGLRRRNITSITGFMSDQKPSHGDPTHIVEFLRHPTAVITGTATVAHRMSMAVIYWDMEKISRGKYKITMRLMSEDASKMDPLILTDQYIRLLQKTIDRNPSIWLWTHKRWKYPVTMPGDPDNIP